jgi:DNA polymerase elongation subunit (family B)
VGGGSSGTLTCPSSLLQVGKQNAAECQPLIQEPPSAFYEDPVLVLDFQSLYPSIMIGYNYCYSTCLGRVEPFRGSYKLGWSTQHVPEGQLGLLKDHVTSKTGKSCAVVRITIAHWRPVWQSRPTVGSMRNRACAKASCPRC